MAIIKFETNVPREVALKAFGGNGIYGKPVQSKFLKADGTPETQLQFTAQEGLIFVSEFAGEEINKQLKSLGVQPDDPITITKKETPVPGKKAMIRWLVEKSATPPPANPASAAYRNQPAKIPYHIFLRAAIRETAEALKECGEQWSDASRQGMVSTLVIQAGRDNMLSWYTSDLEAQLAASIQPKPEPKPEPERKTPIVIPPPAPKPAMIPAPWTNKTGMLKVFNALQDQMPLPMYMQIMSLCGVQKPDDFQSGNAARDCYAKLLDALDQYRRRTQDPTSYQAFAEEQIWQ